MHDEESFMYSIIISLHYYDISHNPERISTLRPYINNYDFTDIIPQNFEMNNPNISLSIIDDDKNILYNSRNISNIAFQAMEIALIKILLRMKNT